MKHLLFLGLALFLTFGSLGRADQDFAIIGDAGEWNANTQAVLASIEKTSVRKLVLPGDNLYDGDTSYDRVWSPWKNANFRFSVVAIGNHSGGYLKEARYFKMPAEYYAKNFGPDLKFIVLNSDNSLTEWAQAEWLEEELSLSHERFLFVVYHHPSLTLAADNNWREREDFQRFVRPILFKHRSQITAVINGHDHTAGLYHFNDLPVIVSGATHGVRPPGTPNGTQANIQVRTDWVYDMTPYWVKLTVKGEACQIEYVRASDNFVGFRTCIVTGRAAGERCRAGESWFAKAKGPAI